MCRAHPTQTLPSHAAALHTQHTTIGARSQHDEEEEKKQEPPQIRLLVAAPNHWAKTASSTSPHFPNMPPATTSLPFLLHTLASAPLVRRLLMLLCACVAGDMVLRVLALSSTTTTTSSPHLLPLLLDNATHAVLALLAWWVVLAPPLQLPPPPPRPPPLPLPLFHSPHPPPPPWRRRQHLELLAACVLGSALDLDHFLAAGSLALDGALHLTQRPPAHCLTTLLGVTAFVWATLRHGGRGGRGGGGCCACWRKENSVRYSALFLTATLSHQLRDAIRRGLWLCHLGVSSPPLPYPVYMVLMVTLPLAVRRVLKKEEEQEEEGGEGESVLWQRRQYQAVARQEEKEEREGGVELPNRRAMVV